MLTGWLHMHMHMAMVGAEVRVEIIWEKYTAEARELLRIVSRNSLKFA
jgi:hypothetical protein